MLNSFPHLVATKVHCQAWGFWAEWLQLELDDPRVAWTVFDKKRVESMFKVYWFKGGKL